jgi:thymidylate kinase
MITHRDGAHEHVDWAYLNLKPGDTVLLKVIETERVDKPKRRRKTEGPTIEESERRELKRLRKKYPSLARQPSNKPLQRTALARRR